MPTEVLPGCDHASARRCTNSSALRLVSVCALVAVGITILMFPAARPAQAVSDTYCYMTFAAYEGCNGPRHSLTGNRVATRMVDQTNWRVCAGAWRDGAMYGSYACGYVSATHCYGGTNLLYPRAHNGRDRGQAMYGRYYYNQTCP